MNNQLQPITKDQCHWIQTTWKMVTPIAEQASEMFYSKLFADNPNLMRLFEKSDMSQQKMRLIHAIDALVNSVHQIEDMTPLLLQLGNRHQHYGADGDGYRAVGAALLHTLSQGLGDAWNEKTEAAWTALYQHVSTTMQEGTVIPRERTQEDENRCSR